MRIVALLSLLTISPLMGMFRATHVGNFFHGSGRSILLPVASIYPKQQKQQPPRLQNNSIKEHAKYSKLIMQKIKAKDQQQQPKKNPKN